MRTIQISLLALMFIATMKVGHASLVENGYLFEEYRSYAGTLEHSEDKSQLFLISKEGKVELQFAHDEVDEFFIDDLGSVTVFGYYSRFHSVLLVEEILQDRVTFS